MEENNVNDILGIDNSKSQENSKNLNKRYPALRTISGFYMVLAWIIGILTILGGLYMVIEYSSDQMKLTGAVTIVVGLLTALGLAAISESIKVFIDIEHNTRIKDK